MIRVTYNEEELIEFSQALFRIRQSCFELRAFRNVCKNNGIRVPRSIIAPVTEGYPHMHMSKETVFSHINDKDSSHSAR